MHLPIVPLPEAAGPSMAMIIGTGNLCFWLFFG
jgi:hypothetical protein